MQNLMTLFGVLYFVPFVIARMRGISSVGHVFFMNLLLGWTGVFWLLALHRAINDPSEAELNRRYGVTDD